MSDKNYTLAQLARLTPCQHHYTFQIRSDDGSHTNWMNLTRGQFSSVSAVITGVVAATPANHWSGDGEGDPHAGRYDCERAALALGSFTDDELANGAFMNYDQPLDVHAILSKKEGYYSPIAWMTAVKDRIRWLSRSLTACQSRVTEEQKALLLIQGLLSGQEWDSDTPGEIARVMQEAGFQIENGPGAEE
jgi:hypothetical protein